MLESIFKQSFAALRKDRESVTNSFKKYHTFLKPFKYSIEIGCYSVMYYKFIKNQSS